MATFRPLIIVLLILVFPFSLLGQFYNGSLYFIQKGGQSPGIYSVEYPQETLIQIDSGLFSDFCIIDSFLYASTAEIFGHHGPVFQYHLPTLTKTDSLPNLLSLRLTSWQGKLLVANTEAPFLRVFDPSLALAPVFQLDTLRISFYPEDFIADGDSVYLMYQNSMTLISQSQEDTLRSFPTPHPYPTVGYNTSCTQDRENLYIGVDYATGAIRTSMLIVKKSDLMVEDAFHIEFQPFLTPPVVANKKVFVYQYDDYYDVIQDSLFQFVHALSEIAIAADTLHHQISVWDLLNKRLYLESWGSRLPGIDLDFQPERALWIGKTNNTAIEEETEGFMQWTIYPIPAKEAINIRFGRKGLQGVIILYDAQGRQIGQKRIEGQDKVYWELKERIPSYVWVRVQLEDGRYAAKLLQTL